MNLSQLLQHRSSGPTGHGITLGTPRYYDLSRRFFSAERGGWRLIASIAGHDALQRRVSPPEPLVAQADFADLRSGDAPPWLHYVRATNP
jgi:hypothetical protein